MPQELADSLRPHIIPAPRKYYQWGETQEPDVWFEPVKVRARGLAGLLCATQRAPLSPLHQRHSHVPWAVQLRMLCSL